jgi:hypothetical protein
LYKFQSLCYTFSLLHNTTPVKFGKFATPVYLRPTIGVAGELSPAGFYYAQQQNVIVNSPTGASITQVVIQHHPVKSFSATIPEQYRIPYLPEHYHDVIQLPTTRPNHTPSEAPQSSTTSDPTPPSTPAVPTEATEESLHELSPSSSELLTLPTTSSSDTSAQ